MRAPPAPRRTRAFVAPSSSDLQPEPEARDDRDARLVARVAVVEVVSEPFDARVVIHVLDVEVRRDPGALELPTLVEPHVELVAERQPAAERRAVELRVGAGI